MSAGAAQSYQAGLSAFAAGDLPAATAQFQQAVSADPRAFQAHHALAATHEQAGRTSEAESAYKEALRVVSDYEPAIAGLAQLYIRAERLNEAESFLSRQRSIVPESAAVLASLAELRSVQQDTSEAQRLAQEALKKDPAYRPAMVVLARDHYRSRRLDLALYTLTAILDGYGPENPARDKNNAEARMLRALIYKEQSNRKGAISELRRVVELRPDLVDARLNLAVFMLEAGNAAEAVPLLEGALAYDPADVLLHLNLGDAYRLQGRPEEALKQLEWVARAAPKLPQTHYNLALVYLFSPKIQGLSEVQAVDKAIASIEMFLRMQPRARPGAGDDADELLKRANNKKAILEALKEPAPSPSGGASQGGDAFDEFE
jgi:tetratricopeptide (TPR) repeat protein